jgi:positive regulator of sigma E activity
MTDLTMEDSGLVTEISGRNITVELVRGGGCKSCSMQGLCFKKSTPAEFRLVSDLPLEVGDRVQLDISPGGRTLASLLIFGLPLLFLFCGFLLASLWLTEIASVGVGFIAMGLAFLIVRKLDPKLGKRLQISILRKL